MARRKRKRAFPQIAAPLSAAGRDLLPDEASDAPISERLSGDSVVSDSEPPPAGPSDEGSAEPGSLAGLAAELGTGPGSSPSAASELDSVPPESATRELGTGDFNTVAPLQVPAPPRRPGLAPPPGPDPLVGRVLSGYRLDERLGSGGVGSVYKGTQLRLERQVAIKVLHEGVHATFKARFEREAMALAALRHPNIVSVTDYGVDEGTPFLVMELLDGETLHYRLSKGLLAPKQVFELSRELLRALSYVHQQGLVHRDLKPGNVFIERLPHAEERLRLLDFGLAKFIDGTGGRGEPVTRHGDIVGTPSYMAPEQVAGDAVDARTDTYSAGVVLFQMLAGRPPYEGEPAELLKSHLLADVPKLAARGKRKNVIPRPELEAFLARALAKPRDARFQTADEMLAALEAIAEPWFLPVAPEPGTIEEEPDFVPTIPAPASSAKQVAGAPRTSQPQRETKPGERAPRRRRTWLIAGLALGAGAVLATSPWSDGAPSGASELGGSTETAQDTEGIRAREQQTTEPDERVAFAAEPSAAEVSATDAPAAAIANEQPPAPEAPAGQELIAEPAGVDPALAAQPSSPEVAPESSVVAAVPIAPVRPPAKNPWAAGVPRALAAARKAAFAGERGNERMILALRRYNRESGQDTRGHLLLARLYRNRKWRDDALKQYQTVYEIDPSARGASDMLEGLLQLVARGGSAGKGAGKLIERAYGEEALPALERSIRALVPQNLPAVQARIMAVRDAIAPPVAPVAPAVPAVPAVPPVAAEPSPEPE